MPDALRSTRYPPNARAAVRGTTGMTNKTSPTFSEHLAHIEQYHAGLGNLPVIWWQTPMGVPSSSPGGTPGHYRDNREDYFLKHPSELTAVGGLAVVFSAGASNQT